MIDVSDDGHVPDVLLLVHHHPNFVYSEVDLETLQVRRQDMRDKREKDD